MIICTLAATTSCNMQVKKERLARIDSLAVHLNYVREQLQSVDSIMIVNRTRDIGQTSAWVYENITDTLASKEGISFGDYMRVKKYYGKALGRYSEVSKELRYSEDQLKTLREDVSNNFYSEEEFNGYFNTEATSIKSLVRACDELMEIYASSNNKYERSKTEVVKMIDSVKSIIYASEPIAK